MPILLYDQILYEALQQTLQRIEYLVQSEGQNTLYYTLAITLRRAKTALEKQKNEGRIRRDSPTDMDWTSEGGERPIRCPKQAAVDPQGPGAR